MPTLRQFLRQPGTYLLILFLGFSLVAADALRKAENQLTGRLYVELVRMYQLVGRPLLEGRVQCRFRPSCSEYSIRAVKEHGLVTGLLLTQERLRSCIREVPLGTFDPPPPR